MVISLIASIVLLLVFFCLFVFETNIINVGVVLLGLIPIVGPILLIAGMITSIIIISLVDSDWEAKHVNVKIRDSKMTRWLFNTTNENMFVK